jgi:uncharacterized protein (TIGR00369 family)
MSRAPIVNDWADNPCFACSPHNPRGLGMVFERAAPGVVECRYTAQPWLSGAPGVVHGGVQAVLIDDAMAMAVRGELDPRVEIVTAELQLRYRRPVPIGQPLLIRAQLLRSEGRSFFVEGQILDAAGTLLTSAQARWAQRRPDPAGAAR